MIATIIKILPMKESRTEGEYIRVEFLECGTGAFYKTDLVPTYRNFARWKPLLKVGNILKRLDVFGENSVNADSFPELYQTEEEKMEEFSQKVLV